MRNIRLTIAYDGTNYAGWQVQPELPTVQGVIEAAITQLTGDKVRVHGSGRTDAGVHALGQVAHFQTAATIPPDRWRPALNGVLPANIVVGLSEEVPMDFHARYSAKRKTYRYLIHQASARSPLPWMDSKMWRLDGDHERTSASNSRDLDVEAMRAAGQCLLGTHDFSSFESKSSVEENSVRTVFELTITCGPRWNVWGEAAVETSASEVVSLSICADGFLYNMVRSIVGTLVEIGQRRHAVADMVRVLAACDRSQAGPTAPPQGLYLVNVDYGITEMETLRSE